MSELILKDFIPMLLIFGVYALDVSRRPNSGEPRPPVDQVRDFYCCCPSPERTLSYFTTYSSGSCLRRFSTLGRS